MGLNGSQLKEYEMLKNEILQLQERIHKLTVWALAGFAALWGVALDRPTQLFSFLLVLVPALCVPFLFAWAEEMRYTGRRIALYIRAELEHDEGIRWETWLETYRASWEKRIRWLNIKHERSKKGPMGGRISGEVFTAVSRLVIVVSGGLSCLLITQDNSSLAPKRVLFVFIFVICALSYGMYGYFKSCRSFENQRLASWPGRLPAGGSRQ